MVSAPGVLVPVNDYHFQIPEGWEAFKYGLSQGNMGDQTLHPRVGVDAMEDAQQKRRSTRRKAQRVSIVQENGIPPVKNETSRTQTDIAMVADEDDLWESDVTSAVFMNTAGNLSEAKLRKSKDIFLS